MEGVARQPAKGAAIRLQKHSEASTCGSRSCIIMTKTMMVPMVAGGAEGEGREAGRKASSMQKLPGIELKSFPLHSYKVCRALRP